MKLLDLQIIINYYIFIINIISIISINIISKIPCLNNILADGTEGSLQTEGKEYGRHSQLLCTLFHKPEIHRINTSEHQRPLSTRSQAIEGEANQTSNALPLARCRWRICCLLTPGILSHLYLPRYTRNPGVEPACAAQ